MVALLLIPALLLTALPVWGQEKPQSCRSCHPAHYAAKGNCTSCHGGNPRTGRKNIAHQAMIAGRYAYFTLEGRPEVKEGERLIGQYTCRRCHQHTGKGNRLAISLDLAAAQRTADQIAASIKRPVPGMPDFRLSDEQVATMVNALFKGALRKKSTGETPLKVHFADPASHGEDLFSRKCGPCHLALTDQLGAVGAGNMGPNLSGLFSRYYAQVNGNDEQWNEQRLLAWVNNPRAVKPLARMRPVQLSARDVAGLRRILQLAASEETE